VDFVLEKAKDGTTPCEIVHMSWLTPDMKHCFWPGNSQYAKAFQKGGKPGNTWKKWPVIFKSFSDDLQIVREARDKLLDETFSTTEASDQEVVIVPMALNNISGNESSSDSDDSAPTPKRPKALPKAPAIPSTSFFGLLDQTRPANKSTEVPVGPTVFTSTIQSDTAQQSNTQDIPTSSIAAVGTPSRTVSSLDKSVLRRLERVERKIDDVLADKLKDSSNFHGKNRRKWSQGIY
ncbi:unnamed protein product, partial [Allacma fusca]